MKTNRHSQATFWSTLKNALLTLLVVPFLAFSIYRLFAEEDPLEVFFAWVFIEHARVSLPITLLAAIVVPCIGLAYTWRAWRQRRAVPIKIAVVAVLLLVGASLVAYHRIYGFHGL